MLTSSGQKEQEPPKQEAADLPQNNPGCSGHDQPDSLPEQAWEAFSRDLEDLLRTDPGKWVAYRGADRVYTGDSQSAVYQECLNRGLAPEELFVELVYPAATEKPTVFLPPTPNFPEDEA
jgi:hypothetical protein